MLSENTEYTVFPIPTDRPIGEVYRDVYPLIPTKRNEGYFSSPLTSGGAKRLYPKSTGKNIGDIIKHNSNFVEAAVKRVEGTIFDVRKTLPHRLGTYSSWGESGYNRFWLCYLSGIEPEAAEAFDCDVKKNVNHSVLNDYSRDRESRLDQYRRLLDQFHTFIQQTNCSTNPINRVVFLPDHFQSLGCTLERELTSALEIPGEELCFDVRHNAFEKEILPIAPWLKEDHPDITRHLVKNGGENLAILRQL